MKRDDLEKRLRGLYDDPPVPETLSPDRAVRRLEQTRPLSPRKAWRSWAAVAAAAAVLAFTVMTPRTKGAAEENRKDRAADGVVLCQELTAEEPAMSAAGLEPEAAAFVETEDTGASCLGKTVEGTPSTKEGCLPGCTEEQCRPDCPNYEEP